MQRLFNLKAENIFVHRPSLFINNRCLCWFPVVSYALKNTIVCVCEQIYA